MSRRPPDRRASRTAALSSRRSSGPSGRPRDRARRRSSTGARRLRRSRRRVALAGSVAAMVDRARTQTLPPLTGSLPSLRSLDPAGSFAARHIGPRPGDTEARCSPPSATPSLESLVDACVPEGVRDRTPLALPAAEDEAAVLALLRERAEANDVYTSMIGLGYYGTVTPPVIQRNVLENPAWYTAYTPYQPEISQGRLEALINFQTMVADLTGLDVAGASMLDEATAAAEAMTLVRRAGRAKAGRGLRRRRRHAAADPRGAARPAPSRWASRLHVADLSAGWPTDLPEAGRVRRAAVLPGRQRRGPRPPGARRRRARGRAPSVVVAADLLALTLLEAPGEWGADVACGTSQRFGVPMGYGGPHAGYLSVREGLARQLPGRLVGVSVDADGDVAYRLALQTREQHIRREKATSNICTAQVLLAVMAGAYAVYHGPEGLAAIAARVHRSAVALAGWLRAGGLGPRARALLRHPRGARSPAAPPRSSPRPPSAGSTCGWSTPTRSRSPATRRRPPAILRAVAEAFGVAGRRRGAGRRRRRRAAGRPAPPDAVPDAPGLLRAPLGDGDAALPADAERQGPRARPHDDPAGLLHDEAQRRHRDGRDHLAGVREPAPVRPGRAGARLRAADRRAVRRRWPRSPATPR